MIPVAIDFAFGSPPDIVILGSPRGNTAQHWHGSTGMNQVMTTPPHVNDAQMRMILDVCRALAVPADLDPLLCRIATLDELEYFNNGGILSYVLRQLAKAA